MAKPKPNKSVSTLTELPGRRLVITLLIDNKPRYVEFSTQEVAKLRDFTTRILEDDE